MGSDDAGGGGDMVDPSLMEGDDMGAMGAMGGQGGSAGAIAINLKHQTLMALQELGIVVGVCFMVAFIFFAMIFVEKICDSVNEVYHKKFHPDEDDPESADPAALVGTFKRYKNWTDFHLDQPLKTGSADPFPASNNYWSCGDYHGCYFVVAIFFSTISLEKKCDYVKEVSQHLERQPSIGKIGQSSEHIWKTQETLWSLKTVVPANRLSTKMKQPLKNGSASLYPVPNMNCPWIAVEIIIGGFLVDGLIIFSVFVRKSDYVKGS